MRLSCGAASGGTSATGGSGAQAGAGGCGRRDSSVRRRCASACARVDRADDADLGAAGLHEARVTARACRRTLMRASVASVVLVAVGMVAVDRLREGAAGHAWPGGCWPRGSRRCMRCALALPDVLGKGRLAESARAASATAWSQQLRIGQRCAARSSCGRCRRCAPKLRAQVGPGFAQRVLVERRVVAVARGTPLAAMAGGRRWPGRPSPAGIAPAAGVEVDLHVDHRHGRAFDQVDLGAAGLRPVLDRDARPAPTE